MSCFSMLPWILLLASTFEGVGVAIPSVVAQSTPVIIDTDMGTFMDDTFALALALELHELDIRLVVTASHDTVGRARVVAKHLSIAGADHIPIGIGVPTSNETGALFGWAEDFDLVAYPGGVHEDGVKAMQETIKSCSAELVTLIEIGPHTNVKSLLERFPGIEHRVRVVVMGGSILPGIRLPWGHVTPVNTTNEKIDSAAARAMLYARWSQTPQFAPIATTYQVVIKGALWQALKASSRRSVRVVLECYQYWWNESRHDPAWITHGEAMSLDPSLQSPILFDAEAVHIAGTAQWLTFKKVMIDFSDYGRTLVLPMNSSVGGLALFALNWTAGGDAQGGHTGLNSFCNYLTSALLNSSLGIPGTSSHMRSSPWNVMQV